MVLSHLIEVFNAVLDSLNRFLEHVVITIKDFERNQSLFAVFEGLLRVQVCHQRLLTLEDASSHRDLSAAPLQIIVTFLFTQFNGELLAFIEE